MGVGILAFLAAKWANDAGRIKLEYSSTLPLPPADRYRDRMQMLEREMASLWRHREREQIDWAVEQLLTKEQRAVIGSWQRVGGSTVVGDRYAQAQAFLRPVVDEWSKQTGRDPSEYDNVYKAIAETAYDGNDNLIYVPPPDQKSAKEEFPPVTMSSWLG